MDRARHSCLYEGHVRHCRKQPHRHEFSFPLAMFYLDLDELPEVFEGRWLWSARRRALSRFHRADHLGDPRLPLADAVRQAVAERTGRSPRGPIRLLTQLRYAGYVMNPISLYYCFDEAGEQLETVVAEVTSTPWNESITYVLEPRAAAGDGATFRSSVPKRMHVSPFMGMDLEHVFGLSTPGQGLRVSIEDRTADGQRPFRASLDLQRRELESFVLARFLLRYPFQPAQVTAAIYWQALRLWRKGTPFHPHPRNGEDRMEVAG